MAEQPQSNDSDNFEWRKCLKDLGILFIGALIAGMLTSHGFSWFGSTISEIQDNRALDTIIKDEALATSPLADSRIAKANSLGISHPDIRNVSLQPNEEFHIQDKQGFSLRYTIVEVEPDDVTLRVEYVDSQRKKLRSNLRIQPIPEKVYDLLMAFRVPGMPKLFFAIIERPTPMTAIIATGLSNTNTSSS